MRVHFDNFNYPLWDDLGTIVVSYRGFYSRKSKRQKKLENIALLSNSLSDEYQSASEIAKKANISFHQAVKLLQIALERLDTVESKRVEWVDCKKRNRSTFLYRKKQTPEFYGISIFNQQLPNFKECNVTVHRCGDD